MSKYRPMMACCGKPMDYHWNVGTRKVKGYWQFKCYTCLKEIRV
uniref:Uncharacterized protein n=4 Tax=Viruses TaxID=10239 RepID=A0AAU8KVZ8_9CAUD